MTEIVVYTDGACPGNGKKHSRGGVGVHFPACPQRDISEALRGETKATNNRAELTAVIRALQIAFADDKLIAGLSVCISWTEPSRPLP